MKNVLMALALAMILGACAHLDGYSDQVEAMPIPIEQCTDAVLDNDKEVSCE